jgi:hypothetical protein
VSHVIESILTSVKKNIGVLEADVAYDPDILMYLNTAMSTLNQLGVGPEEGFLVEDESTTWGEFLGTDPRLNHVRTYVTLRVRMMFDPPQTSYLITAIEKQIDELAVRLNYQREETMWTDPNSVVA